MVPIDSAEAFCYSNPDHKDREECEIFIKRRVPGLSTVIFRVIKSSVVDIAVKGSSTLDIITNENIDL